MNGFDDFDTQIQSDEMIPAEFDNVCQNLGRLSYADAIEEAYMDAGCLVCGGKLCDGVRSDFCSKDCADNYYGMGKYATQPEQSYDHWDYYDDGRWDDDPNPYAGTYSEE